MSDLRLNFTPLSFAGDSIAYQELPYRDRDQLSALRREHVGRFAFVRRSEFLFALPLGADAPSIGTAGRAPVSDLHLMRALVEQRLVTYLSARKRPATGYRPLAFTGRKLTFGADDFDEWIQARSRLLISPRVLELPGERPTLGLVWDVQIERALPASLLRLLELGVDPIGLVFETESVSDDVRFAPRRRLAGSVERIEGDTAVLGERHRLAAERIGLADLYLEPSTSNIRYLANTLARHGGGLLMKRYAKLAEDHSRGIAKQSQVTEIAAWLRNQGPIELQPGLNFESGQFLAEGSDGFPRFRTIPGATYIFDSASPKADIRNAAGLQRFGPYSRAVFTPSRPEICVICDKARRGQTEVFLKKLTQQSEI